VTTHPAILVDERRPGIDHPRRIPLVLARPLLFLTDGFTTLPAAHVRGLLSHQLVLSTGRKPAQQLKIGDRFRVARHPWRLVHAAYEEMCVRAPGVTVTWSGDTLIDDVGEPEPQEHSISRAVSTFSRLVGRELLIEVFGPNDLRALAAIERAPKEEVARLVRGLFPDAWKIEEAVREQAAILDPSMLA
jgi:hypothetical protein